MIKAFLTVSWHQYFFKMQMMFVTNLLQINHTLTRFLINEQQGSEVCALDKQIKER